MSDILVIGSLNIDMTSTVKAFPKGGETTIAESFYTAFGGKGLNQAVSAARLGANVELIGMIGNDSYGKQLIKLLDDEHIDHHNLLVNEELPTGMAHIQVDQNHQNKIVVIPGANNGLTDKYSQLIEKSIQEAKIVVIQNEIPMETNLAILRLANKYKKITIWNPAPYKPVKLEDLKLATYITPNENELGLLTDEILLDMDSIKKSAKGLVNKGVQNVVVTLGDKGSLFANKDTEIFVKPFKVQAVDTVAAGDSFVGAFATRLLETDNINDVLLFSNAYGALTVTKRGAISSLSNKDELQNYLNTIKK